MLDRPPLTVVIAVRNEAANLPKCLCSVANAARVLVVDSASTDGTGEIARAAGAEVLQFDYRGGYPKKRQWALDTAQVDTPWTLLLDADEVVSGTLWSEVCATIESKSPAAGYTISKNFHFLGRRFRFGGFSHEAVTLFQAGRARFERLDDGVACGLDMEVHERVIVDGTVARLRTPLIHEDLKGLAAYLDRHNRYSTWEAQVRYSFLQRGKWGSDSIRPRLFGNAQERRRFLKQFAVRVPCEPLLWFLYHYIVRLGILEGRPGWIASLIRSQYISQVRAKLYELKIQEMSDLS